MLRGLVTAGVVITALFAAGNAVADQVRYPIAYDTVLSGLDPAMPCSQVDKAIHWVKLDMSLMKANDGYAGPLNTDTAAPHSGDNREIIGGPSATTNHADLDRNETPTYISRKDRSGEAYGIARADYLYLRGMLATCTEDRRS